MIKCVKFVRYSNERNVCNLPKRSLVENAGSADWSTARFVQRSDASSSWKHEAGNLPSSLPSFTSCRTRQSPVNSGKSSRSCLRGFYDTCTWLRDRWIRWRVRQLARFGKNRRVHTGYKGKHVTVSWIILLKFSDICQFLNKKIDKMIDS